MTYELLCKLAEHGVREQSDLDFKQTLYHPKNEKDKRELVKDVCTMANSGGGWIICGIAEDDSAAARATGVNLAITSETDVHQLLESRLDPPVTVDIRVYESANRDTTLVAIRVPDSPNKPHLVRATKTDGQELVDTRTFRVPIRKGASTVWLDERAIRSLYRRSLSIAEETEALKISRLEELAAKAADEFPGVALALVLSPHEQLSGRLNKQEVQKLLQEVDSDRFTLNQGYSSLHGISGSLIVGDHRYIGKQASNRRHALIEIGFDGTIAIAIQLAVDEPELDYQARNLYATQPDETTQNEVEYALIEAFNCASQLSNLLNPVSDSELHARLVPHGEAPSSSAETKEPGQAVFFAPEMNRCLLRISEPSPTLFKPAQHQRKSTKFSLTSSPMYLTRAASKRCAYSSHFSNTKNQPPNLELCNAGTKPDPPATSCTA